MSTTSEPTRVERWEAASEWPLAAVAALFLAAYAWPILDNHLHSFWRSMCRIIDYGAWLVFVIDYGTRLSIAQHRAHYFLRNLFDLAIIALPVLRPLRLLRLVMLLRVLNRRATDSLRGRVAVYTAGGAAILLFCGALAVLDAERHARGTNITTFGDALWWALTTVSTVGYGDHYPVSTEGRFVAAGLMVGGIALLGVVTASFATWLVDRVRETEYDAQAATRGEIAAVMAEIGVLSARLDHLHPTETAVIRRAFANRDNTEEA